MPHRLASLFLLTSSLSLAGCGWFSADSASSETSDESVGDAATVDMGADDNFAGEFLIHAKLPPPSSNPQRDLADPYYIIGETMPEWELGRWANHQSLMIDEPITLEKLRGRVVIVRFWTDSSDACRRTMPALQRLAEEFRGEPVLFLGIYFPSDVIEDDPWPTAEALARDWGVTYPIAEDYRTHNSWWLSRYDNLPKTPTFVIGPDGQITYMQPGPELYPSDEVAEELGNADYNALRAAITNALDTQLANTVSE